MDYLPVFARIKERPCLVVGGGDVACRKTRMLLDAGAAVTVNAPELNEELCQLRESGEIQHLRGDFEPDVIEPFLLVFAATDDPGVNQRVFEKAEALHRLANVVDDPDHCSFIMPAVVDRSPVVLAISSGGAAPVLARMLRERLEAVLPTTLGQLAGLAGNWRRRVKRVLGSIGRRRLFWERVFAGRVASLVDAGRVAEAEAELKRELADHHERPARGEVYLVGAGPGDPGLLTLRALQLMQQADVVLYDRLVSDAILDLVRRDARRICVGKQPGSHQNRQEHINRLILDYAGRGLRVCRLKGGDPFIFGRGGEELEQLAAAGIDFQVVPGITAAAGCAAYAGIPLTHREHAQSVSFVTAHCQDSLDCLDWRGLARDRQTLAFYMGVGRMEQIGEQLIRHGRAPNTPVAIIHKGTLPDQRSVTCTLADLGEVAGTRDIRAPSILIIGEVASHALRLGWYRPDSLSEENLTPQPVYAAVATL